MAKIESTAFDSADYLNTTEDVIAYLDACIEDGSPTELRAALDTIARSRGISELSKITGASRAGFYKVLEENRNPSFEAIRAIIAALGLRFTVEPVHSVQAG